jgi:hypothetical protein
VSKVQEKRTKLTATFLNSIATVMVVAGAVVRHRQLVGRLITMEPYDGVSADLGCDYAASRAPAISAQSSKA